jgi:DNA-directed RNA polymerase subunit M/transcription elongation factor TFIIS
MAGAEPEEEARAMSPFVNPARCCPECSSKEYVFRGRKKIAAEGDQPPAVETRYMCKNCAHAWKERVAVKAG